MIFMYNFTLYPNLPLAPSLYSSLYSQQIGLRLIKCLQQSPHLGTGPGLRSMPHALLTLSALPSAQPIKPLVSLKSCLPPLTPVIGNENKVDGFPKAFERNSLFRSLPALGHTYQATDVCLIWSLKSKNNTTPQKSASFSSYEVNKYPFTQVCHCIVCCCQLPNYAQSQTLH